MLLSVPQGTEKSCEMKSHSCQRVNRTERENSWARTSTFCTRCSLGPSPHFLYPLYTSSHFNCTILIFGGPWLYPP